MNEEITKLKLEIEEHQGIKFLYDSINQEFICQGKTLEELAILFNERRKESLGMLDYENNSMYFISF